MADVALAASLVAGAPVTAITPAPGAVATTTGASADPFAVLLAGLDAAPAVVAPPIPPALAFVAPATSEAAAIGNPESAVFMGDGAPPTSVDTPPDEPTKDDADPTTPLSEMISLLTLAAPQLVAIPPAVPTAQPVAVAPATPAGQPRRTALVRLDTPGQPAAPPALASNDLTSAASGNAPARSPDRSGAATPPAADRPAETFAAVRALVQAVVPQTASPDAPDQPVPAETLLPADTPSPALVTQKAATRDQIVTLPTSAAAAPIQHAIAADPEPMIPVRGRAALRRSEVDPAAAAKALPQARVDVAATVSASFTPAEDAIGRHLAIAHDGQWLDTLAKDIAGAGKGDGKLHFRLDPDTLGALTVQITQNADGASVRLTASTEAARAIIADAQPRLVAEARAQGLSLRETHVETTSPPTLSQNASSTMSGNGGGGGGGGGRPDQGGSTQLQQQQSGGDRRQSAPDQRQPARQTQRTATPATPAAAELYA